MVKNEQTGELGGRKNRIALNNEILVTWIWDFLRGHTLDDHKILYIQLYIQLQRLRLYGVIQLKASQDLIDATDFSKKILFHI